MKRIFIVISIAFLSFFISFTVVAQDTESVFDSWRLSKMPEFHEPGYKSFSEWVQTHVVYPETARKNKMEGVVQVSFVVEKDGSLSSARVNSSLGMSIREGEEDESFAPDLDKEAVRVVLSSPFSWTPGRFENLVVRTQMAVDVVFSLSGGDYEPPVSSVDQKPSFQGGDSKKFAVWILANTNFPQELYQKGYSRHRVLFTVDKNGEVINAHMPSHISKDKNFDNELLSVVRSSPLWQPARSNGKPVKYEQSILVDFSDKLPSASDYYAQANTGQNAFTTSSIRASQQAGTTKQLAQNIAPKAREWTVEETLPASGTRRWSCKLYSDGTCTIRRGGKVYEGSWTYESFYEWRDLITVRYDGHRLEVFYDFNDGGDVWLRKYN